MTRCVISARVENKYGVLARVTGLFMRKGFNIDSLSVGETENPAVSRITITLDGDEFARKQLICQLQKLYNVEHVSLLEERVERELLLMKVRNTFESKAAAEKLRGKIVADTTDAVCIEVVGEPEKINDFIAGMKPFGILEMCRTGVAAI